MRLNWELVDCPFHLIVAGFSGITEGSLKFFVVGELLGDSGMYSSV